VSSGSSSSSRFWDEFIRGSDLGESMRFDSFLEGSRDVVLEGRLVEGEFVVVLDVLGDR